MNSVERIKAICKERRIPIMRLEQDCGFANGYFRKLKRGTLPDDRLFTVAEYLGLTPEYLSTGEEPVKYYESEEAAEIANRILNDPDLRALMQAADGSSPENLKLAEEMLLRFKGTNPNG